MSLRNAVLCSQSKSVISSPPPLLSSLSPLPSPPWLCLHFLVQSVNDATLFPVFPLSLPTRLSVLSLTWALFMNLVNTGKMHLSSLLSSLSLYRYWDFIIPQISFSPCVLTSWVSASGFSTTPLVMFSFLSLALHCKIDILHIYYTTIACGSISVPLFFPLFLIC